MTRNPRRAPAVVDFATGARLLEEVPVAERAWAGPPPSDEGDQQGQAVRDRQFQAHIDAEYARERIEVDEAQDRFEARVGEQRAEERVQVHQAQNRFRRVIADEQTQARTDRDFLQAQLHQSQRLEVLGQLAGGVAHDFNNLLAVILNYAAFVADELDAPGPDVAAACRDVAHIKQAAERAAGLTHQLLAFARRDIMQPRVVNLNQVVTDVAEMLRRTIGDDIVLHTDLATDLHPALADTTQLEQVLVNLALNARDAMSTGGTLRIDTENVTLDGPGHALLGAGPHVRLRVHDTGTGIPAEVIPHVFEPFFTTKPEGAGTGLGLSTVYGIVAQTQGTITIDSALGVGTTFTILLPTTEEVADAEPETDAGYQRARTGETILIVEDQDALRDVTERIFTHSGYRVLTAANGADAIALTAHHDGVIHLLLTDVVMPSMLGKEVAIRIRQMKPDIEVLFMSGYAQPVLASQGKLDRDVHLVGKPFTAAAITEAAGRILDGHRQRTPNSSPLPSNG
jgi:signal transduction histidine kinase/ActR/RegA family two-component response regulator